VAAGRQARGVEAVTAALAAHGGRALRVRPVAATLEDVFIALIGGGTTGAPSAPAEGERR
jgi:hypothetical protein